MSKVVSSKFTEVIFILLVWWPSSIQL